MKTGEETKQKALPAVVKDISNCPPYSGTVRKKTTHGQWQERYYFLNNSNLCYKADSSRSELSGAIDLGAVATVRPFAKGFELVMKPGMLYYGENSVFLKASPLLTTEWISKIKQRLEWISLKESVCVEESEGSEEEEVDEEGRPRARTRTRSGSESVIRVVKEGWLMKKSHNKFHMGMQERYVRISGDGLFKYFKGATDTTPQGLMHTVSAVCLPYDKSPACTSFEVRAESRIFHFQCTTHEEMKQWVAAFHKVQQVEQRKISATNEAAKRKQVARRVIAFDRSVKAYRQELLQQCRELYPEYIVDEEAREKKRELRREERKEEARAKREAARRARKAAESSSEEESDSSDDESGTEEESGGSSGDESEGSSGDESEGSSEEEDDDVSEDEPTMTVQQHTKCGDAIMGLLRSIVMDTEKTSTRPPRYDVLAISLCEINMFLESRLLFLCKCKPSDEEAVCGDDDDAVEENYTPLEPGEVRVSAEAKRQQRRDLVATLGNLHCLIVWLSKYQSTLRNTYCPKHACLGVLQEYNYSADRLPMTCLLFTDLPNLCDRYVNGSSGGRKAGPGAASHLHAFCLTVWERAIKNVTDMIQQHQDSSFYTTIPTDTWELLHNHLQLAMSTNCAILHVLIADKIVYAINTQIKTVCAYVRAMDGFMDTTPGLRENELQFLCALANDTALHIEEVMMVVEKFELEEIRARIDQQFDIVTSNLVSCGELCLKRIAVLVMADLKEPILDQLFTENWLIDDGECVEVAIATMNDYCDDLKLFLVEFWFDRFKRSLADTFIVHYAQNVAFRYARNEVKGAPASTTANLLGPAPAALEEEVAPTEETKSSMWGLFGRGKGASATAASPALSTPQQAPKGGGLFSSMSMMSTLAVKQFPGQLMATPATVDKIADDMKLVSAYVRELTVSNEEGEEDAHEVAAAEVLSLMNDLCKLFTVPMETLPAYVAQRMMEFPLAKRAIYETAVACCLLREDDEEEEEEDNRGRARGRTSSTTKARATRQDVVGQLQWVIPDDVLYGSGGDPDELLSNEGKLAKYYKEVVPSYIIDKYHATKSAQYEKEQEERQQAQAAMDAANRVHAAADGEEAPRQFAPKARRSSVMVRKEATMSLVKDVMQTLQEQEENVDEELQMLEDEDARRVNQERFLEEAQLSFEGYLEKKSPAAHNRYQKRYFKLITRVIPSDAEGELPTVRYVLMWYKKKDAQSALRTMAITSDIKLLVKECPRPLVYLGDNPEGTIDFDKESSYRMKLQTELLPDEDNYTGVRAHKSANSKSKSKAGESDSSEDESDSSEDESDSSEDDSDTEDESGSDEDESDSEEDSDSSSEDEAPAKKAAPVHQSLTKTGSMFGSTLTNLGKLATSFNASALLGIQYYSFVLITPGAEKDIVLRSKRIDQLLLWVNILADAAKLDYEPSKHMWTAGARRVRVDAHAALLAERESERAARRERDRQALQRQRELAEANKAKARAAQIQAQQPPVTTGTTPRLGGALGALQEEEEDDSDSDSDSDDGSSSDRPAVPAPAASGARAQMSRVRPGQAPVSSAGLGTVIKRPPSDASSSAAGSDSDTGSDNGGGSSSDSEGESDSVIASRKFQEEEEEKARKLQEIEDEKELLQQEEEEERQALMAEVAAMQAELEVQTLQDEDYEEDEEDEDAAMLREMEEEKARITAEVTRASTFSGFSSFFGSPKSTPTPAPAAEPSSAVSSPLSRWGWGSPKGAAATPEPAPMPEPEPEPEPNEPPSPAPAATLAKPMRRSSATINAIKRSRGKSLAVPSADEKQVLAAVAEPGREPEPEPGPTLVPESVSVPEVEPSPEPVRRVARRQSVRTVRPPPPPNSRSPPPVEPTSIPPIAPTTAPAPVPAPAPVGRMGSSLGGMFGIVEGDEEDEDVEAQQVDPTPVEPVAKKKKSKSILIKSDSAVVDAGTHAEPTPLKKKKSKSILIESETPASAGADGTEVAPVKKKKKSKSILIEGETPASPGADGTEVAPVKKKKKSKSAVVEGQAPVSPAAVSVSADADCGEVVVKKKKKSKSILIEGETPVSPGADGTEVAPVKKKKSKSAVVEGEASVSADADCGEVVVKKKKKSKSILIEGETPASAGADGTEVAPVKKKKSKSAVVEGEAPVSPGADGGDEGKITVKKKKTKSISFQGDTPAVGDEVGIADVAPVKRKKSKSAVAAAESTSPLVGEVKPPKASRRSSKAVGEAALKSPKSKTVGDPSTPSAVYITSPGVISDLSD